MKSVKSLHVTLNRFVILLAALSLVVGGCHAWIQQKPTLLRLPRSQQQQQQQNRPLLVTVVVRAGDDNNDGGGGGPLSFLTNPYEEKIPPELREEIYAAEANTPAAKERGVRVATYAAIALVGISLAFFSAFVTELRNSPLPPDVDPSSDPLVVAGFDWVRSNPVTNFLFTNKIGGGICLLLGAGAGLLAEAELDTKRINAEKIFAEMERRRDEKLKSQGKKTKKKGGKQQRTAAAGMGKKKLSGKAKKRMGALSEVVAEEPKQVDAPTAASVEETDSKDQEQSTEKSSSPLPHSDDDNKQEEGDGGGIMGKIKGFYDRADSMAASQALLLNKELEDRGLVEKITDETGLKVIGREEAAKLEEGQQQQQPQTKEGSESK